tara:strand:+ start:538 stop:1377 length:840 start_codon:yes stop_codon:yes gene_type:complete
MISTLDHIILAVENLNEAEKNYKKIFGIDPVWRGEHKELGTANVIFNLKNTYLELLSANGDGLGAALVNHYLEKDGEGLIGIVFGTNDLNVAAKSIKDKGFNIGDIIEGEGTNSDESEKRKWKNLFLPPELTRGLFSFIIQHTDGNLPSSKHEMQSAVNKLDHIVINTNDADGFIEIYKNVFGLRLALDKTIEAWNRRMLFFRFNKTTIEVIEENDDKEPSDKLWGLAWAVEDLQETYDRLIKEGLELTEVKLGIKDKTLVSTIRSHTHGVPTLIIQHL